MTSLHQRLLTLDAHLDAPVHFARDGWSFGERHDYPGDIAQVDLPRMAGGNLSGGFFVIYTAQGPLTAAGYAAARAHALRRSAEIDMMVARFGEHVGLARTAADAERLHSEGKLIAFKSMENSYPIGMDLHALAEFARAGVRLAGPVHSHDNQLGDSATDAPQWNGLSPLGREWVGAMNALGIVLDGSHASDAVLDQMLELSATPILLSHSSPRATYDHPRNIDDDRARAVARAGGAIGMSTIFLSEMRRSPKRDAVLADLGRIGDMTAAEQADLNTRWHAVEAAEPPMWSAGLEVYMAALLHLIDLVGIDHVCFGADFDGGGGLPGLDDVTALPRITERLEAKGFAAADIAKLWSGNLLRILRDAERRATVS